MSNTSNTQNDTLDQQVVGAVESTTTTNDTNTNTAARSGPINSSPSASAKQGQRQVLVVAGSIALAILLIVVGATLIFPKTQPAGAGSGADPATTNNTSASLLAGSSWVQDTDVGFPLMGSVTKKGQVIQFLQNGNLDLGSTIGSWQMIAGASNKKLSVTTAGFTFLFTMTFSPDNQKLTLTGNVNGVDWLMSFHRQAAS